jgi:hypothetical protein
MLAARWFVLLIFAVLVASFWFSTWLIIDEFSSTDWMTVVLAHSHLHVFFPLFGVLVLAALYLPATIFTHFYWNHVRFGPLRFAVGFLACAAGAVYFSQSLIESPVRGVWEVAPRVLAQERGDPAGCGAGQTACRRAPMLGALLSLRDVAQSRSGLSKFARVCKPDPLVELPEDDDKLRFCAATLGKATREECCRAQDRFRADLARLRNTPGAQSQAALWDPILLPLKSFFIIVVVVIGVLLAIWRNKLDEHYAEHVPAIERGMLVCGFAMLLWPLMDYGYQQVSNALMGRWDGGLQMRLSLVTVPWGLLLLFHFLRRLGERVETLGQVAGIVASGVAILRYENIVDWSARLFGIGAEWWMLTGLAVLTVAGFAALIAPWRLSRRAAQVAVATVSRQGRDPL